MFTKYNDEFIVDAEDLPHGCSSTKVEVICDYCNKTYETLYSTYYNGINKFPYKNSCHHCNKRKVDEITFERRKNEAFEKLDKTCNKYGYVLLTDKKEFTDYNMKVEYICPIHGKQSSILTRLANGHGCLSCKIEKTTALNRRNVDELETYINSFNNNTLLNKNSYVNASTINLNILCGCCNNEIFTTSYANYKVGTKMCRSCSRRMSKNERRIKDFLESLDVEFIQEKSFDGCEYKKKLLFDFYLPKYNLCIEYDGMQHFDDHYFITIASNSSLEETQIRDKIKTEYCKNNNINLLRIPYWDENKIEKIILNKLHDLDGRYSLVS